MDPKTDLGWGLGFDREDFGSDCEQKVNFFKEALA